MNWKELVHQLDYITAERTETVDITGVEVDSRKVKKGDVFVCLNGTQVDGHNYIEEALNKGASAVVTERRIEIDSSVPFLLVQSTTKALAEISTMVYGNPSTKLHVIGVTGTNGKTSVTHFLNQLYRMNGHKTGIIGTIHTDIDGEVKESENTTPLAHDLQKNLHEMVQKNVSHVFMEVSSHALEMGRVWGCRFQHGAYTNLTQDHLDYHLTMDNYKHAKSKLFSSLGNDKGQTAILNADEPTSTFMESVSNAKALTYGVENEADVRATNLSFASGLSFDIKYNGKIYTVSTSLVGRFHVYNLLAAVCVCLADGWEMETIIQGLSRLEAVKGRMETVDCGQDFSVIVDFAHTPDALEKAFQSLDRKESGRVLTIVGCGGNRDKTKRPIMAHIAEMFSDHVYLTSDNPREEDPISILKDMEKGMEKTNYQLIVDRKEAIEQAVAEAKRGDILLIAGKGHEEYQIIGKEKEAFSDVEFAKEFIKKQNA